MDLPTYTSIWRIEKRLYKLYDFRLPMPLPIGQLTVFAAIAVPYVVLLTLLGLPFNHKLIWLYLLPPGVLTWLATRPVLESKRLPELVGSQLRYLAEPRVWCRMAPLAEKDVIVVTGRVWRHAGTRRRPAAALAASAAAAPADTRDVAPATQPPWRQAERRASWLSGHGQPRPGAPAASRPGRATSRAGLPAASTAGPAPSRMAGPPVSRPAGPLARLAGRTAPRPATAPPARSLPGQPAARPGQPGRVPGPARPASTPAGTRRPNPQYDGRPALAGSVPVPPHAAGPGGAAPGEPGQPLPFSGRRGGPGSAGPGFVPPVGARPELPAADAGQPWPASARPGRALPAGSWSAPSAVARPGGPVPAEADAAWPDPARQASAGPPGQGSEPVQRTAASPPSRTSREPGPDGAGQPSAPRAGTGPRRPAVTVVSGGPGRAVPPAVESALAGPSAHRGDARQGRVLVVPGGHRPGKPDQLARDRSRAQLPIAGRGKIVVLGCTVGAGQTMTTLLTGDVLASLRDDKVAVLDLNPGENSLAERAIARPALNQAASLGPSRLEILGSDELAGSGGVDDELPAVHELADDVRALEFASARYPLVLTDPSTSAMPRLLAVADQLVLVAPASAAAAEAITMTFEWLEAHGQASLSGAAIMVMNGVSRRTMTHVEQAERVAVGRCRAIVRVPWDDQLQNAASRRGEAGPAPRLPDGQHAAGLDGAGQPLTGQRAGGQHRASAPVTQRWTGLLSPATSGAYTALAGVLVAALAVPSAGHGQPGHGQPGHGQPGSGEPYGRASR